MLEISLFNLVLYVDFLLFLFFLFIFIVLCFLGEKIGMFAESLIEAVENEQETSTTKEVNVSFIKNKSSNSGDSDR